jgi:thiol-disulfide isomerase/thioredoxin
MTPRFLPLCFLALAWLAASASAQDLAEEIRSQIDTYEKAVRANTQRIIDAQTEQERALYRSTIPSADPFAAQVLQLIQTHPQDPAVSHGLNWLLTQCLHLPQGATALQLLTERHAALAGIARAVKGLAECSPDLAIPALNAVLQKNPHPDEQAAALFALGAHHFKAFEAAPNPGAGIASRQQAEQLFQRLITDFPQVAIQGLPLSHEAASMLFEIQNLSVGAQVPEVSGTDHLDIPFKLSDYRGKHVVLIFWGDWCHACHGIQAMVTDLAQRFTGKPLAFLGINTDDQATAKKILGTSRVPWRCWLDGSTSGPITSEWNLHHFPTLYLIGPDGIILEKNPPIPDLAVALEKAFAPPPSAAKP